MSVVLLGRITLGEVPLRTLLGQVLALPGLITTDAAAIAWCAANAINLKGANLSGCDFDGADISGLWAPMADLKASTLRGVAANRLVSGRRLELSAAQLQGAILTSNALTQANLMCTHPTAFRATVGAGTLLRGCDWSECPDVLELPVARSEIDRVGKVLAVRNGAGWQVHAGERGVVPEAQVDATFGSLPAYDAARAWLRSAEGVAAKAAIDGRAVGTGPVVKPSQPQGGAKLEGALER